MAQSYIALLRWPCPCDEKEVLHVQAIFDIDEPEGAYVEKMRHLRRVALNAIAAHREPVNGTD